MGSIKNFEIEKGKDRYFLNIKDDATWEEYWVVVNHLISKLNLNKGEVNEVNDFDNYYFKFIFQGILIVLAYSNDFGITIYFFDGSFDANSQIRILEELIEKLEGVPL